MAKTRESPAFEPAFCNCQALRQAARQATQLYDRHLAQTGLRTSQFSILARLTRMGPLPVSRLAAAMGMDRTTASRAIGPLRRDQLIAIGTAADGRKHMVNLTPAGAARFRAAFACWRAAQREFESAYGAKAASDLRAALARVPASDREAA